MMRPLFVYLSALTAAFTLLHRLWSYAPLETAFLGAAGVGISVYAVLSVSHLLIRQIVERARLEEKEENLGAEMEAGSEPASL